MSSQDHRRRGRTWVAVGVLLGLLLLTFPVSGVGACPGPVALTTDGSGCVDNLLSWHGWVRFPHWDWLPLAYVVVIVGLVLSVHRALKSR
jgi:hypothetical protein